MKRLSTALFALVSLLASASVNAVCQTTLSGNDHLDWGAIQRGTLNAGASTLLAARDVTLQLWCDNQQQVRFALSVVDLGGSGVQPGEGGLHQDGKSLFGLGSDPLTGHHLGNFILTHKMASYDATRATHIGHGPRGTTRFTPLPLSHAGSLQTDQDYSILDNTTGEPASASRFIWVLGVEPQLRKSSEISAAQEIDINGSVQFIIRYL